MTRRRLSDDAWWTVAIFVGITVVIGFPFIVWLVTEPFMPR